MTIPEPQQLIISAIPLDGPGARVVGSILGEDMILGHLREIIDGLDENLDLTDKALADPALNELAQSVRGAHLAIAKIAEHLYGVHRGMARGNLNYPEGV